jgi:hypothetical protein
MAITIPTKSKINSRGEIINPTKQDVDTYNSMYATIRKPQKKNSWVKKAIDKYTPVGVYKQAVGLKKDLQARDASIIEGAQLQQVKKYGERISPSAIKNYFQGGISLPGNEVDKRIKDYLKTKKRIKKEVT